MKRPTKETVEQRIVDAVTKTVATYGIGGTNMAKVAKEAKISAGTLYLHFASKDVMLQQVYLRIKREFHDQLMQAAETNDPYHAISGMWHALLAFQQAQPRAFLFLETTGAAQVLTADQKDQIAPMQYDIENVIQNAIQTGSISAPSLDVAINILIGPAMHLARKYALAGHAIPQDEMTQTFERVWASLGGA